MKRIFLLTLCLLALIGLVACGGGNGDNGGTQNPPAGDPPGTEYKVTLILENNLASVKSENPVTVKKGESATFRLSLSETAVFRCLPWQEAGVMRKKQGKSLEIPLLFCYAVPSF